MKVFFQVVTKFLSYISQFENDQELTLHSQLQIEWGVAEVPWLSEQNNEGIDNTNNIRCHWRCSLVPSLRPAFHHLQFGKVGRVWYLPAFPYCKRQKLGKDQDISYSLDSQELNYTQLLVED